MAIIMICSMVLCFTACEEDKETSATENAQASATVGATESITATAEQTATSTATVEQTATSTATATAKPTQTPTKSPYADVKVGDKIKFGKYEQDNVSTNGKEEISWIVLAKEDGKMLVVSEKLLDAKPFHENEIVANPDDNSSAVEGTAYALANGLYTCNDFNNKSNWWLRTCNNWDAGIAVMYSGKIDHTAMQLNYATYGVRPAMWSDIK